LSAFIGNAETRLMARRRGEIAGSSWRGDGFSPNAQILRLRAAPVIIDTGSMHIRAHAVFAPSLTRIQEKSHPHGHTTTDQSQSIGPGHGRDV
jgi:hypothetical protein